MKLLKWLIKMAKKILNLDTENGEQSWEDMPTIPSGTATVGKLFHLSGYYSGAQGITITREEIGITDNTDLTTIGILSKYKSESITAIGVYLDEMLPSSQFYIYPDKIVYPQPISNRNYIIDVAINTDAIANALVGTQINSDWNATEGVAQILNKPTIPTVPTRTEYLTPTNLTGTEHIFTGATLGITGDLRSRIKNIKCFAVDSSGDYNGALIANEFIYETDVTVNTTTDLSGSFRIKLFIEYA